jgi:hypothetical protein
MNLPLQSLFGPMLQKIKTSSNSTIRLQYVRRKAVLTSPLDRTDYLDITDIVVQSIQSIAKKNENSTLAFVLA